MQIRIINSPAQLCELAEPWDDLWQRSASALPTLRAELLAHWLRTFRPRAKFQAVVVEDSGQWVAALPLAQRRLARLVRAGELPTNPWSSSGDLLLDPSCDRERACAELLRGISQLRWPLLWLDGVPYAMRRWQWLLEAADDADFGSDVHPQGATGLIHVDDTWDTYVSNLSGDFRRKVRGRLRQLAGEGEVRTRTIEEFGPGELEPAVRLAFEIEDRSWKGPAGTSVMRNRGMLDYFLKLAEFTAQRGELMLTFLEVGEQPIGFEFGYRAKGVYFAHKVSFDDDYSRFGPGHLLKWLQLPALFERSDCQLFDYHGPLTPAIERWADDRYAVGRVVLAPPRLLSGLLLAGYRFLAPRLRQLRGHRQAEPTPEPAMTQPMPEGGAVEDCGAEELAETSA